MKKNIKKKVKIAGLILVIIFVTLILQLTGIINIKFLNIVPIQDANFYHFPIMPSGYLLDNPQSIPIYQNAYFNTPYGTLKFSQRFLGPQNYVCTQIVDVYFNNNKIDTMNAQGSLTKYYSFDGFSSNYPFDNKSYVGYLATTYGGCGMNWNSLWVHFNQPDIFDIQINPIKTTYIQGENLTVQIIIKNNLYDIVKGNLILDYEVPTIIGTATKEDSINVTLNKGTNEINYTFPTEMITNTLRIKPSFINLQIKTSWISNLGVFNKLDLTLGANYYGGAIQTICNSQGLNCQTLYVGNVTGNSYAPILDSYDGGWTTIAINPRPIYYLNNGTACISGYNLNKDETYCLSNDISGLSCVITGCPIGFNPPYACTSSGYCSQTLYVPINCTSDLFCQQQTGISNAVCDLPTGLCINNIIKEKVVQCSINSDCISPCDGKIATCQNNQCVYSGLCNIKQCTNLVDCPTSPCSGVSYSCTNNLCIQNGKCIYQPKSSNIWTSIGDVFNNFWNWVKGVFGG